MDLLISLFTIVLSVVASHVWTKKSMAQNYQQKTDELESFIQERLSVQSIELERIHADREADFSRRLEKKLEIVKADFIYLAQEHMQDLGRRRIQDLPDDAYDDAEVILKTKVGYYT